MVINHTTFTHDDLGDGFSCFNCIRFVVLKPILGVCFNNSISYILVILLNSCVSTTKCFKKMVWGYIFGTCLLLDIVGNFTLDGVIPFP